MDLNRDSDFSLRTIYSDLLEEPLFTGLRSESTAPVVAPAASISIEIRTYLEALRQCTACGLHVYRSQPVIACGETRLGIMCVGDFPSSEDDRTGKPFSGAAGELLHKMLIAMKLAPEEIFYTNLVVCRSKNIPLDTEIDACRSHLEHQLKLVRPRIILAFGESTARWFSRSAAPLSALRQEEVYWQNTRVFCTHHPRELLTHPERKRQAWDDLQAAMKKIAADS